MRFRDYLRFIAIYGGIHSCNVKNSAPTKIHSIGQLYVIKQHQYIEVLSSSFLIKNNQRMAVKKECIQRRFALKMDRWKSTPEELTLCNSQPRLSNQSFYKLIEKQNMLK